MIPLAPILAALVLLATARVVGRTPAPDAARRLAVGGAATALVLAAALLALELLGGGPTWRVVGLELRLLPPRLLATTPLVVCVIAVLATALAPLASHPPATLRRMLLLFAIAAGSVVASGALGGLALAALWALSARVAWQELRARPETGVAARAFARYQAPSAALFALGALLLLVGLELAGALACLAGIAIREATVPAHGWLPKLVERAPLGLFVAFVAPQLGVQAHLMMLAGKVPPELAHGVAALGALTAVLAAALGVVQDDGRRALAWIVISQTGLVAFGLEGDSLVARTGALVTWQVLALATSGFAMTLAALEARRGTLSLREPAGSFARTPRMAVALLVLGFASVGLPTTLGFVAEDLLVQGSTAEFPLLDFALIVATALNGMTVMRAFFALFSGSRRHHGERDVTPRETWALTLAIALLFVAGAFPGGLLRLHQAHAAQQAHAQAHAGE